MTLQLWCKTTDMLCYTYNKPLSLLLNLAIHLRYMTTWNYNRTGTMPISYKFIMIRSAVAQFPPEYSDRNVIVKTVCETEWLSGKCRASLFVSQEQDTICMTVPVITATASAIQHSSGCITVCPASFIPVLSLSLILIPRKSAYYPTFHLYT